MNDFDRIDEAIESHDFSGVVKVSSEGHWVYERAAGYRDRPNETDNDLNTRFGIASGTKFFTALAIGRLIDMEKLSLDTKVLEVINYDFGDYDRSITVEHLLTHTSGMPDYYDEDKIDDFDNFKVAIPWDELHEPEQYFPVFPKEAQEFKPGTKFKYNNGAFVLLAALVAKVSGKSYTEFVQKEVFDRAGMTYSGFFPMNQMPKNTANGYIDDEFGYRTNIYILPIVGAGDGGAFSTVDDMDKLWKAFLSYELLSKELTDAYMTPQVQEDKQNERSWYGYGLWLSVDNDNVVEIAIIGCDAGVSFKSGYRTDENVSYTVMSNTTDGAWSVTGTIREMEFI